MAKNEALKLLHFRWLERRSSRKPGISLYARAGLHQSNTKRSKLMLMNSCFFTASEGFTNCFSTMISLPPMRSTFPRRSSALVYRRAVWEEEQNLHSTDERTRHGHLDLLTG